MLRPIAVLLALASVLASIGATAEPCKSTDSLLSTAFPLVTACEKTTKIAFLSTPIVALTADQQGHICKECADMVAAVVPLSLPNCTLAADSNVTLRGLFASITEACSLEDEKQADDTKDRRLRASYTYATSSTYSTSTTYYPSSTSYTYYPSSTSYTYYPTSTYSYTYSSPTTKTTTSLHVGTKSAAKFIVLVIIAVVAGILACCAKCLGCKKAAEGEGAEQGEASDVPPLVEPLEAPPMVDPIQVEEGAYYAITGNGEDMTKGAPPAVKQ